MGAALAHTSRRKERGGRDVFEERGGVSGTQIFVYQKWPDKIFPMVNCVFSHDGHFVLEGGGWGGLGQGLTWSPTHRSAPPSLQDPTGRPYPGVRSQGLPDC